MSEKNAQAIVTMAIELVRRAGRQGIAVDAFEQSMRQNFASQPRIRRSFTGDSLAILFVSLSDSDNIVRGMDGRLYWTDPDQDATADGRIRTAVSQQVDAVYLVFDCMRDVQRLNGNFTTEQIIQTLGHRVGLPLPVATRMVDMTLAHFSGMLNQVDDRFQFTDINEPDRAATMSLFHRLAARRPDR